MEDFKGIGNFSLLGGPLQRLGCRLGLVRHETNTLRIGLLLGVFLWTVLIALAFYSGFSAQLTALPVLGVHVRLLIVIPLFFLAETLVAPRWSTFVEMITRSGVVPHDELPVLDVEIRRILRWKDSWLPEAVCLLAAALLSMFGSHLPLPGTSTVYDPSRVTAGSAAAQWYWIACMPLFRFLVLRWTWRLGLWSYFLSRLAKLKLHLVPTHPDSTAGLGYLEIVHIHFTPLVLAISALQSASFTEEITQRTMSLESIYPALALILVADAVLFLGPLLFFSSKLWACQVRGQRDYMEFAEEYVVAFERKWWGAPVLMTSHCWVQLTCNLWPIYPTALASSATCAGSRWGRGC